MGLIKRNCDNCGNTYDADTRNLKRGWGLCCSKSCAATKREKKRAKTKKPFYVSMQRTSEDLTICTND